MEKKAMKLRWLVLLLVLILGAFSRILPHPLNFSPIAALGLFAAGHFVRSWQALFLPLAAVWLSDLYLNNVVYGAYYEDFVWFYEGFYWQYGAYLLMGVWGLALFQRLSWLRVGLGALGASVIFFLLSNFGVWYSGTMYEPSLSGLMLCYVAGLPFFKASLLGDIFYTFVLFGGFELVQRRYPSLAGPRLFGAEA